MSQQKTPFYFGGAASCVAATVSHPLDLTKTRLQNLKGKGKTGMFSTMVKIASKEGPFRLYAGLSAALLRQATYSTVRFGVYDKLKQSLPGQPTIWQLLACSSTAGALGGACGNPGDVINVRMQSDGQLPLHQRRNYRNALDGVFRIAREEGVTALFRGLGPNVNRAILMTSSQCVSYDLFKDLLMTNAILREGLTLHFTASVLAGFVATTVCSPVDVIRTRIMAASASEGSVSSLRLMAHMYKAEGFRSFFKGWTPAFMRVSPQTIITFIVLERFKQWHAAFHERRLISIKM
ncbi:mitochondrial carrier domain-containing protein [Syncephalastrum racemosum]|uniref:Mitochondrial carrier domain-containing protein n=1 Tax=Syncephalastrum racemosum TaxID=13706 RepID=A0A1X2HLI4_SYNRA|nr:mitochondrial carrier domain-containing protein [Syncephalastrum racemosum]